MTLDDLFTIVNSPVAPLAGTTHVFETSIASLQPGEEELFVFDTELPTSVTLPDSVFAEIQTLNLGNDVNPGNNHLYFVQEVVASYDPNNKLLLNAIPSTTDRLHYTENTVEYVINFQNEGTGNAIFVEILDTLPQELDPQTVNMLAASHEYTFSIVNDSVLKWRFDDIMLPPASQNYLGSMGYVTFTIQRNPALQIGDSFKNRAGIYFDFNEPVITEYMDVTIDQVVDSSSLLSTELCADDILNLIINPYNDSARTFTVEMSDVNGTFVSPNTIGTFTGTNITLTPAQLGLSAGDNGYRLRAFSTNPLAEPPVATEVFAITQPEFSIDTTNATDASTPDGSVTITATSGSIDSVIWAFDNSTQTSLMRSDLLPGTYSITVYDGNGCVKDTTIEIGIQTTIGRLELNTLGARLFPNPTSETLTLELPTAQEASLEIYSTTGQRVLTQHLSDKQRYVMNISHLPVGVYVVKVQGEQGQFVQRVVKE